MKKKQQAMPKKKKGKNADEYDLPDLPEVSVLFRACLLAVQLRKRTS